MGGLKAKSAKAEIAKRINHPAVRDRRYNLEIIMITRNGKIARLPAVVREELNQRLYNGQEGKGLLDWLNGMPEVQSALAVGFDGRPVSEQNLSEWRQGGYAEWEMRRQLLQDARDMAGFGGELEAEATEELVDKLALVLSARYGQLLLQWDGEPTDEVKAKIKVLGQLCKSVLGLQRGRQRAVRTRIVERRQEWAELEFERKEKELERQKERNLEWRQKMLGMMGPEAAWWVTGKEAWREEAKAMADKKAGAEVPKPPKGRGSEIANRQSAIGKGEGKAGSLEPKPSQAGKKSEGGSSEIADSRSAIGKGEGKAGSSAASPQENQANPTESNRIKPVL